MPLASRFLDGHNPAQVASVTRSITSSESVTDMTSSDGGANNALANTLLTAQLMFWGIESVAAI
jgi:hypothetical protein